MNVAKESVISRTRILACSLRSLQQEAARFASGATVHELTNHILTSRVGLELVEARLLQGQDADTDMLLELVEKRVCAGRALLARMRQSRLGSHLPAIATPLA
jgi:hypothetical protein